nr:MAG TPA: hypothetical protein [Caudoviricetes sp.]
MAIKSCSKSSRTRRRLIWSSSAASAKPNIGSTSVGASALRAGASDRHISVFVAGPGSFVYSATEVIARGE